MLHSASTTLYIPGGGDGGRGPPREVVEVEVVVVLMLDFVCVVCPHIRR